MVNVVYVDVLVNVRISLTNIALHRNVDYVLRIDGWSRASGADIYVENATYSGPMGFSLGFYGAAVNMSVILVRVTVIVAGVFPLATVYPMVLLGIGLQLSSTTVLLDNIVLTDNPALGGSASGRGPIAMMSFHDAFIANKSVIIVRNSNVDLFSVARVWIVYLNRCTVSSSQLDVATTQLAARSLSSATGALYESSVVTDSSIRIDTVSVNTATARVVYNSLLTLLLSQVNTSTLIVVGSSFSSALLGRMLDLVSVTAFNSTVLVAYSSFVIASITMNSASIALRISDVVLSGTTVTFVNVTCTGGYFALLLEDSMVSNSTITISASLLMRPYTAVQIDNTTLNDGTSLVLTDTRIVVQSGGIVLQRTLWMGNSVLNVTRSVTIESATPSSTTVLSFYIVGTTVNHSTVNMNMAPSPSFAGRPLSMSAVGFYNGTNVTFDMGPANWTRPSTFDSSLVYFDNSVVHASTLSIALPTAIHRIGAEIGSYSNMPPVYLSGCVMAKGAIFTLHGPGDGVRTAFQWPSKPALIYISNIVVQTCSRWLLDSILLHNTVAGVALMLSSIIVDGPGTEVRIANVSVFVGPSAGARPWTVGTIFGVYVGLSTIKDFAALRLQLIQCTHDMSQLDTRCIFVDRSVITDGATLQLENFKGPVSSSAVPVAVRSTLILNMSHLVVWGDSSLSVNATVSNRSLTGDQYRVGFALQLYNTTIKNSSLVAFANSVFSDASVPNTAESLAAAFIVGVHLVNVSVFNSTVTLPNVTFTQCPQQSTTAIALIHITNGCVFNGSTLSLQRVRTECAMLLNAENSTAWEAGTDVRLANVTSSKAQLSSDSRYDSRRVSPTLADCTRRYRRARPRTARQRLSAAVYPRGALSRSACAGDCKFDSAGAVYKHNVRHGERWPHGDG
jgi:hypothetical protein